MSRRGSARAESGKSPSCRASTSRANRVRASPRSNARRRNRCRRQLRLPRPPAQRSDHPRRPTHPPRRHRPSARRPMNHALGRRHDVDPPRPPRPRGNTDVGPPEGLEDGCSPWSARRARLRSTGIRRNGAGRLAERPVRDSHHGHRAPTETRQAWPRADRMAVRDLSRIEIARARLGECCGQVDLYAVRITE